MRALKAQYFFALAIVGAVGPYTSVYFKQLGLDETQIGRILGVASIAVVLAPALVTGLADTRIDARRLMAGLYALVGIALVALSRVHDYWPVLLVWAMYFVFGVPMGSLQDGINFSIQEQRRRAGLATIPFTSIRVWGSIGFIAPSIFLFWLLRNSPDVRVAIIIGAFICIPGIINTFFLPDPQSRLRADPATALPASTRLPTLAAGKAMLRGPVFVFCVAIFLLNTAGTAHYSFFPLYLTDKVGFRQEWVGIITSLGVIAEIIFMLGYGPLLKRFGSKNIILAGVAAVIVRLVLLAAFPNAIVAVTTQVLHGVWVLVLLIMPAIFLNEHAEDRYRNSMQGLFAMFVAGMSRIAGNFLAGPIAKWSLTGVFWYGAGLAIVAGVLVVVAFVEDRHAVAARPSVEPA